VKAVILAAGRSTRSYPLTLTRPKPVVPVLNRPLLDYNLNRLVPFVDGFVLVVGYFADMVKATFGKRYGGITVEYAYQTEQKGTADAVLAARGYIKDDFLLLNADDIYSVDDFEAVARYLDNAVLGVEVDEPTRFGILITEGPNLRAILEKPEFTTPSLVNAGLYRFTPEIFEYLENVEPSRRGEYELVDAVTDLAGAAAVRVVKSAKGFLSVATAADLIEAQKALWFGDEYCRGRDCRVASSASVGSSVTVGDNCIVGENVVISDSILFDGVKIDDDVEIVNSVLGYGVEVAERTILDGAIIGDGVVVGRGARLRPGSRVWPRAVVPASAEISAEYLGDERK
jgi:NDP-sugar pyrophosphorylase family protein